MLVTVLKVEKQLSRAARLTNVKTDQPSKGTSLKNVVTIGVHSGEGQGMMATPVTKGNDDAFIGGNTSPETASESIEGKSTDRRHDADAKPKATKRKCGGEKSPPGWPTNVSSLILVVGK